MTGKLVELSRLNINYSKPVGFRVACSDSTFSIMTDQGLELFDLSCNLNSYSKHVELISSSLTSPPRKRSDSTDLPMWGMTPRALESLSVITSYAWSPSDAIFNHGSVLAVLTSYGSVSFFARRRFGWNLLLDLTDLLIRSKHWNKSEDINVTRERNKEVESSSICWGSLIKSHSCYFLTAQRNGTILFWKVTYAEDKLMADLMCMLKIELEDIKTMTFIPKTLNKFTLVCSSLNGFIKAYDNRIEENNVVIQKSCVLWPYQDLMVLNHITWLESGSNYLLVCAKNRHLLVFLISSDNELISQYVNNVCDFTITALTQTKKHLYIGCTNNEMFKVNIITEENALSVQFVNIHFKDDFSEYVLHDFACTINNAIWAVTLVRKPIPRRHRSCIVVVFFKFDNFCSIDNLLQNTSQQLTHMWDCVELLRLQCAKDKRLPNSNYEEIFSDPNLTLYHRKLYLILAKLHYNYALYHTSATKSIFDTLSSDTIRDTLLVNHALSVVDTLFKVYNDSRIEFSAFQKQAFLGCCHYVEWYCKKYKNNLSSYVNSEALNAAKAIDPEFSYKCADCKVELVDFTCSCGHLNHFCTVSLTPEVHDDYLLCRICGSKACSESYLDKPMCVFCDVYLDKSEMF